MEIQVSRMNDLIGIHHQILHFLFVYLDCDFDHDNSLQCVSMSQLLSVLLRFFLSSRSIKTKLAACKIENISCRDRVFQTTKMSRFEPYKRD